MFALVLPAEVVLQPNVSEAAAGAGLLGSLLECVEVPCWVGLIRGGFVQERAEVDEVFLGGGTLGAPRRDSLVARTLPRSPARPATAELCHDRLESGRTVPSRYASRLRTA